MVALKAHEGKCVSVTHTLIDILFLENNVAKKMQNL